MRQDNHEANYVVVSDVHFGAKGCNVAALVRELNHRDDANILVNGDVFDAIVAGDKRYSASEIHPDAASVADPINWASDLAYDTLAPFASRIVALTRGNHERTIIQRAGYDPAKALASRLGCRYLDYCGFIRHKVASRTYTLFMHHGCGSVGSQFKRLSWIDADVIITGHHHQMRIDTASRVSAGRDGRPVERPVYHIQTSSFVDSSLSGYAAESGYAPGVSSRAVHFTLYPERIEVSL